MLARAMPEAEVVTIEDRGHFIPTEAPEPFREALFAFCNTHPVGPGVRA
jgi:pimeloyl-ACP methyl ester carboxylesterase